MLLPQIYHSRISIPQRDGSMYRGDAGSFMLHEGRLHHLSAPHDGILADAIPEGPVTADTFRAMKSLPPGLQLANQSDIGAGRHLDFIPDHPLDQEYAEPTAAAGQVPEGAARPSPARPPSVFHYRRAGHDRPHTLEVREGHHYLDGAHLSHPEVQTILGNLQSGAATLRYKNGGADHAIQKAERVFRGLMKAEGEGEDEDDMDPTEAALTHFSKLATDQKSQDHIKALRRKIYEDPVMAGLGSRYAWDRFHEKNRPGVYGSLDLNDLKATNDTHGHLAGDAMIRAYGQAAREAAKETAPGQIKLFRTGGDEVAMHATAPSHAQAFIRALRTKLDAVPPIGGTHRISFSAGLGPDYATADTALYKAKARKTGPLGTRVHQVGQTPHLIHSLMPGAEGQAPQDYSVAMPEVSVPSGTTLPSPTDQPRTTSVPAPVPTAAPSPAPHATK